MKVLYISKYILYKNTGGGSVSSNNLKLLENIEGFDIDLVTFPDMRNRVLNKFFIFFNSIFGLTGGLSIFSIFRLISTGKLRKYDVIWCDSSLYGVLVYLIRKISPKTHVACFYHNVETDFYRETLPSGVLYYPFLKAVRFNEYLSTKYSNQRLVLTANDGNSLVKHFDSLDYHILPVVFEEKVEISSFDSRCENVDTVLFVGSNFPPNIEAIKFIIQDLAPESACKFSIAGKGLKDKFSNCSIPDNVEFLGFVDELAPIYASASVVITPIFSGSGMKVKVAEALSHGKVVIGTPFSFIGYDLDKSDSVEDFLVIAENKTDFLRCLNNKLYPRYSSRSVDFFNRNFVIELHSKKIRKVIMGE